MAKWCTGVLQDVWSSDLQLLDAGGALKLGASDDGLPLSLAHGLLCPAAVLRLVARHLPAPLCLVGCPKLLRQLPLLLLLLRNPANAHTSKILNAFAGGTPLQHITGSPWGRYYKCPRILLLRVNAGADRGG